MSEIYCCITIDTEPDCDIHWRRSSPLTFNSVLYGIPKLLRPLWNKYDVNPTFFVSPEVLNEDGCCDVVLKKEIELGSEIGTHLHSEYIKPKKKYDSFGGSVANEFPCFAHDTKTEFEKIKNLTHLIEYKTGIRPVSYRAGRFGADLDTIKSLIKLEYRVDSSVTPHINWSKHGGPDHSKALERPYWISQGDYYKENKDDKIILEVPVTIGNKRFRHFGRFLSDHWLFYEWLRPTHMTAFEMCRLIENYIAGYKDKKEDTVLILNMMFHSMEIIPKATPYVRTSFEQKWFLYRIKKVISYLYKRNVRFVRLKDIYGVMK